MFSWISSLSSTIYLYIIASLLTLILVFGGLSWYLKGVADKAESALGVAQDANSALSISLDKKTQSCDITDKQLAQYQSQTNVIVQEKDNKLSSIDVLPSKPVAKSTSSNSKVTNNETDVVDIDSRLPQSLIDILHTSSSTVQGTTTVHP